MENRSTILTVSVSRLSRQTSPRKFSRLRLDSKQIEALVVPIIYRHLVLTKAVVACFGKDVDDEAQLQAGQDVRHC